ncbi:hypothetical protein L1049_011021 [Liquidambar formosana]|uniref:Secreted protein n=1 Tax=Liquidambar formosana TaxID=63359 RepID=A0AAP0RWL3_LIQFO
MRFPLVMACFVGFVWEPLGLVLKQNSKRSRSGEGYGYASENSSSAPLSCIGRLQKERASSASSWSCVMSKYSSILFQGKIGGCQDEKRNGGWAGWWSESSDYIYKERDDFSKDQGF